MTDQSHNKISDSDLNVNPFQAPGFNRLVSKDSAGKSEGSRPLTLSYSDRELTRIETLYQKTVRWRHTVLE